MLGYYTASTPKEGRSLTISPRVKQRIIYDIIIVEVKKLILLGITLAGIALFSLTHVLADTGTPDNQITNSTSNSSASATITITMYAMADE